MEEVANQLQKEQRLDKKADHAIQGGMLPTIAEMERWAGLRVRMRFDDTELPGRALPK